MYSTVHAILTHQVRHYFGQLHTKMKPCVFFKVHTHRFDIVTLRYNDIKLPVPMSLYQGWNVYSLNFSRRALSDVAESMLLVLFMSLKYPTITIISKNIAT